MSNQDVIDPSAPEKFNDIALGIHLLPTIVQIQIAQFLASKKDENELLPAEYEHILDALAEINDSDLRYDLAIEHGFSELHSRFYFCKDSSDTLKACIAVITTDERIMADALQSKNWEIREGLAENKNTSSSMLLKLSEDEHQGVLRALAENILSDSEKPKNLNYHVVRSLLLRLEDKDFLEALESEFSQTMDNARLVANNALAKLGFQFQP